jgi:hypothetical protein
MNRLRGTLVVAVLAAGNVLVPAQQGEAALFDCVRRLFHRRPVCDPCESPVVSCPEPVVREGAYCNPCQTCTTSYVCRSYMEPQVCNTTRCAIEAQPAVVRRSYWDPCSCCYRTYYESTTTYVRRCYSVPVTTYVQRSYLQPVTTCTTPTCPTSTCPTPALPTTPAVPAEETQGMPSVLRTRPGVLSRPNAAAPAATRPNPAAQPLLNWEARAPRQESARRWVPLSLDMSRLARG